MGSYDSEGGGCRGRIIYRSFLLCLSGVKDKTDFRLLLGRESNEIQQTPRPIIYNLHASLPSLAAFTSSVQVTYVSGKVDAPCRPGRNAGVALASAYV